MPFSPAWERFDAIADIGRRLYGFREVTSTMDVAWEMADGGAPHGTAVLAETQTRGRGRFGRPWEANPRDAMLLSVVLRPPLHVAPLLSIVACLAVRDAVGMLAGLPCTVKWPNDLQLSGRKLCGILTEVRASTDGDMVAVLGIGLNLDLELAGHPELRDSATSLRAETGRQYRMTDAVAAVLARLDDRYGRLAQGDDPLGEWRQVLNTLGKRVTVRQRDRVLVGVAEDVDGMGRLLLRTDDGLRHALAEGDVTLST